MTDDGDLDWRRSRACETATCVEVAGTGGEVWVRDSKDRSGPVLRFSRSEWDAFVTWVRSDDPPATA
jgi:uncharacterized protein DUF397